MRNIISARRDKFVARQVTNASFALATTASTSATDARSTSACTSPVAGLYTLPTFPDVPATTLLLTQWLMRCMSLLIVFVRGVTELIEVLAEVTLNELAVTFLAGEGVFFDNNHST